jgi:Tfp pilus assembly protein FimV
LRCVNLKSACLLLSLCHAGAAAALGLGEITVRSHLGQPLHATVTVLDAPADATADCFSLSTAAGGMALPQHPQLSLDRTDGQALLHIRTPQSIYDPIAQFVLIADCGARLQRDYVVLLDPPPSVTPPVQTGMDRSPPPAPGATPPAIRPAAQAASTATARRPHAPRARPAAQAAPRLVLSGRRMASEAGSLFALKLDTNLPDPNRTLPEGLTATELSDENTALTRKLAHLESRLAELQRRNAELEARRARNAAKSTAAAHPPTRPAEWPLYLLITGLLTSAGVLVVWLRRSRQSADALTDTWVAPEMRSPVPLREMAATRDSEPLAQPPSQDSPAPVPERMPEIAPPPPEESTEVKDDILDQAEVYMAHGHGELAIHLLQEHLRDAPDESPVPWLLLLDLLHREGNADGYALASAECRRHFNINLSGHPVSQDSEQGQGLEAYPHLIERLVAVWRSPELDDFFQDLIYDNRGGTRMGFEPSAYRDILLLRAIAKEVLPHAA